MLAAGCSRVWILPPHLPHTRVRAGGYLPNSPLCRMGTSASGCRPQPGWWLVLLPPFPHPLPPLPSPSPPSCHMLQPPYPTTSRGDAAAGALPKALWPLRPSAHPRVAAVIPPRLAGDAAARAREAKHYSDPPPSASSWSPLLLDMLGRPLRASKPACASCPDCRSPPAACPSG